MMLVEALIENGLLQFGQFQINGVMQPFLIKLDFLASYPDALKLVRDEFLTHAPRVPFDRILCPLDALPLAVAVALELQIPVVYSSKRSEAAVFDLVGAYDIGYPTLVIANYADSDLITLIGQAERVGLRLSVVWTVIEIAQVPVPEAQTHSLLTLHAILDDPFVQSRFAPGQIATVRAWLARR